MKKSTFLYLSLAAIVVGSFASCQEEDYGFDYATIKYSVYERDFLKTFGDPAPNHQWGFDKANATFKYLLTGELPVVESAGTRAVIKQDMNLPGNIRLTEVYAKPADITEREHLEVYAWFKNHKVNWTNTPTWYQGASTRQTEDNTAHVISSSYPNYGSLTSYSENPLGDYVINNNLTIFNGWIQHVNSDKDDDEVDGNNNKLVGGSDFLRFWTLGSTVESWEHLNDFNAANGYGYGNQSGQNAIMVTNANFNVVTYGSSQASSLPHDKYFIVYLKGGYEKDKDYDNKDTRYEGWYLGLDFEADKENANPNERVKANGVCNDWIIKISDVGQLTYNPARIMCEDLGGSFDTDFNDLVYDVEINNQQHELKITIQAVGGTLPIKLTYTYPNGVEETLSEELHQAFGVATTVPINVSAAGGETKNPIVYTINGNGNIGNFSHDNINVYVYNAQKAEWVNITRLDKESTIPCRICVPNTVTWPAELQSITWAYPGFVDWVKDPSKLFWSSTINSKYLYGTYTPNVTPPSNGSNGGSQNTSSSPSGDANGVTLTAENLKNMSWSLSAYVEAGKAYSITVNLSSAAYVQFNDYSGDYFDGSKTFYFESVPENFSIIQGSGNISTVTIVKR